ncbi:MAG: Eco57I restriction-modification methylase domain-containing protein [Pyrinomonadaceae bacterium]
MASLFHSSWPKEIRLLDAGAGVGALCNAFLDRLQEDRCQSESVVVAAYEIDDYLREKLEGIFICRTAISDIVTQIKPDDFILDAVRQISSGRTPKYTHAILNPPYKKISSASDHRSLLRHVGIETVNLYSAFVALSIHLLANQGQLVAIIPRSFCNGPYYKSFRELVLRFTAIRHIHLFDTRNKAFRDDKVLQENIIIVLEKGAEQGTVTVSTSSDDTFTDLQERTILFDEILNPRDAELFFHIPTNGDPGFAEACPRFNSALSDLFLEVSTGPVVDFRVKEHLCLNAEDTAVPLLYPGHFNGNAIDWPKSDFKKPNAIKVNHETQRWLYPSGFYSVVRRFSSKEEKKRIYASVVNPHSFQKYTMLGFENHLNVFHTRKRGLLPPVAFGLTAFLNSTVVDRHFRRFNGHTQVNATDLRTLKYPDLKTLTAIGEKAMSYKFASQDEIDEMVATHS